MQLYSEILDAGGPAFGAILRHVRDSPNDAFIFHCTGAFSCRRGHLLLKSRPAGKDRTGIAAALLLIVCPSFYLHRPRLNKFSDRKSTRLNSSHQIISYAVFCLKKKKRYKMVFKACLMMNL